MTLRMTVAVLLALSAFHFQEQAPRFHLATDIVVMDVAVKDRDRPIGSLTLRDFAVVDNGVPQRVDYVSNETMPVDLVLVLDENTPPGTFDVMKVAVNSLSQRLHPSDSARVLTINDDVQERYVGSGALSGLSDVLGHLSAGSRVNLYRGVRSVPLNDGILCGLLAPRSPNRRALLVVFSRGIDTSGTVSADTIALAAKRTDVVADFFLLGFLYPGEDLKGLNAVSQITGGFVRTLLPDSGFVNALETSLTDFRSRYLVSYRVTGVALPGWHDVSVKVRGFQVTARRGYEGGR